MLISYEAQMKERDSPGVLKFNAHCVGAWEKFPNKLLILMLPSGV